MVDYMAHGQSEGSSARVCLRFQPIRSILIPTTNANPILPTFDQLNLDDSKSTYIASTGPHQTQWPA